jgi:hypothetical protein
MVSQLSHENRAKIDRIIYAHEITDESTLTGMTPPDWWLGDEDASMSNQIAMSQMRQRS